jgi:heme A synthase
MLKPVDPAMAPANGDDRPVGELVHQLVEQGKTYAMAELDVAKAIATSKAQSFKVPAILLGTAFLLLQAAFGVLGVALLLALLPLMGPLLAGLLAFLIFAGLAGGLAYLAVRQIGGDS